MGTAEAGLEDGVGKCVAIHKAVQNHHRTPGLLSQGEAVP